MALDNKLMKKKTRNVNLDILRILSMFLIVLLHSVDHSGVIEASTTSGDFINWYTQTIFMFTRLAVNCYVLLSGYFLVKSQFSFKKLLRLWIDVTFYSFIIKFIFMIFDASSVSIISLLSSFFSVTTGRYWFITIYFGLYLLSPFINKMISALSKKQHFSLLIILFILLSATISIHPSIAGMNSGDGWGLTWFIFLYLTSSWIRLYYSPKYNKYIFLSIYSIISMLVGTVLFVTYKFNIPFVNTIVSNWYRYDSVPVYLSSICLFLFFVDCNIKNVLLSKFISKISSLTLGVYLIHAHPQLSPFIWDSLNLPQYMDKSIFPFIQIGVCIAIFSICIFIDYIKSKIFIPIDLIIEKSKIINKFNYFISNKFNLKTNK